MKKFIVLLLFTISISVFSQDNNIINLNPGNDTITTSESLGNFILDINQTYISSFGNTSLKLDYNSNNVTKSGLTYNSTGDTIVSVSNDTVVIDDYDDAVIGNSIRFGDPESGTIYTILDTLGSGDSLKLDQICIGNIGDEFYSGCDGYIVDQSDYGNDGIQEIGAYQSRGIWIETDSSCWKLDGIDDYYILDENGDSFGKTICNNGCAISFWTYIENLYHGYIISRYDATDNNYFFRSEFYTNGILYNTIGYDGSSGGRKTTTTSFSTGEWFHIVMNFDGSTSVAGNIITYKNGNLDETLPCSFPIDAQAWEDNEDVLIGAYDDDNPKYYFNGYFIEIKIYDKELTETEITELYTTSRHYTP